MSAVSKSIYKPLSIAISALGGIAAGAVFGRIWQQVAGDSAPPDPKDLQRSNAEVLAAAALQGLIFGLVRAAVDRAGARGYRAVAHEDPK
ncbi:DUF4235 domain-containing protein [Gordonia sp. ABSL49_1]|uniref:DUF4235 domain-containing protein n=1 Tax=Gordonia sp. ABSL49_1 TaxID=2920941 RepID=UPI001F117EF2|nr:DUF4235 domain-containing protein [Gordonia sp. ABSL49_1]MCH5641216.1 DUF4235 domain-containing protein [Gordonia sp. ABSL49_1]